MLYKKTRSLTLSFAYAVEWYKSCITHSLYLEGCGQHVHTQQVIWVVTEICLHRYTCAIKALKSIKVFKSVVSLCAG